MLPSGDALGSGGSALPNLPSPLIESSFVMWLPPRVQRGQHSRTKQEAHYNSGTKSTDTQCRSFVPGAEQVHAGGAYTAVNISDFLGCLEFDGQANNKVKAALHSVPP
jgi:hypothetical protein